AAFRAHIPPPGNPPPPGKPPPPPAEGCPTGGGRNLGPKPKSGLAESQGYPCSARKPTPPPHPPRRVGEPTSWRHWRPSGRRCPCCRRCRWRGRRGTSR